MRMPPLTVVVAPPVLQVCVPVAGQQEALFAHSARQARWSNALSSTTPFRPQVVA
jgi:hypothetical protein